MSVSLDDLSASELNAAIDDTNFPKTLAKNGTSLDDTDGEGKTKTSTNGFQALKLAEKIATNGSVAVTAVATPVEIPWQRRTSTTPGIHIQWNPMPCNFKFFSQ